MEPRIQYTHTTDGVSIAFWTLGEGLPLVYMPVLPWSHIQLEWQNPGYRRWYERLTERGKLVRYDGRGTGLSDRNVADYSVDAHMLDLQAVVESLGVQRFVLLGPVSAAPVAISYAARHPEAVSHLVLWCPWVRQKARDQALWALSKGGTGSYTRRHKRMLGSDGRRVRKRTAKLPSCGNAPRQKRRAPSFARLRSLMSRPCFPK